MRVYLAGRYSRREELADCASYVERDGHVVTSRWLLGNHQAENDELHSGAAAERFAREDLDDLDAAEVLIAFTEPPRAAHPGRGGRHVELGYALAQGKPIIVVGPRENVFCCLADVIVVSTIGDACAALARVERQAA